MTPSQVAAVGTLATAAIKLAEEAKARQARAPKPTDQALVAKAAQALVDAGFVEPTLKAAAEEHLADPNKALDLVHDLASKAAAEIARLSGIDPRLEAGKAVPAGPLDLTKQAAAAEEAANAAWVSRMATFRKL